LTLWATSRATRVVQVKELIGLSTEAILNGVRFSDGIRQLEAFIIQAENAHALRYGPGSFDIWMVAHNGHHFDMLVVVLECLRIGHDLTLLRRVRFVDTRSIAQRCARLKRPLPLASSPCIDP